MNDEFDWGKTAQRTCKSCGGTLDNYGVCKYCGTRMMSDVMHVIKFVPEMPEFKKLCATAYVEPEAYDEELLRDKLARIMLPQIKRALQIHAEPDFYEDELTGHVMELIKVSAVLRIKTEEK